MLFRVVALREKVLSSIILPHIYKCVNIVNWSGLCQVVWGEKLEEIFTRWHL